jgi:DNA-binding response OmpR family regulator
LEVWGTLLEIETGEMFARKHILIVEDDRALATMYRTALGFEGFEVAVATDGVTALRHLDEHRVDLVVLDLHLPQLRGETILHEINADPELRDTPVIVVTADEPKVTTPQATAILRKPCAPDKLLAVIDKHLKPAA